jgi:NitT/TauT family transport system substrate-binding protein
MPLAWMKNEGIMQKWADKYGIELELVQVNDYVGSVNQFIAGDLDAVAVAVMDGLTMPAAGGVDTSIFLITDYSNGNDALMSRSATSVKDLIGQEVWLLQYSVSHYLLTRALAKSRIEDPSSVKTTNISDTETAAAYITQASVEHLVTWNPMVAEVLQAVPETKVLFDSSEIPGEIMDVMIARTDTLKEHPEFGKALTGAWYEALSTMASPDNAAMVELMASAMGTDVPGLKTQMDDTHFFMTGAEAAEFLTSDSTAATMDLVRTFSFDQGLFGQGASSVDTVGIELGNGKILGDTGNVKLRFDASFAQMSAKGEL